MLVKEIYNDCVNDTFCLGLEQLNIVKKIFSADWLYLCTDNNNFIMEDLTIRPDYNCSGRVLVVYHDSSLAEDEAYRCSINAESNGISVVGFKSEELIHEIIKLGIDFVKVYYKYYNVVIDTDVLLQCC